MIHPLAKGAPVLSDEQRLRVTWRYVTSPLGLNLYESKIRTGPYRVDEPVLLEIYLYRKIAHGSEGVFETPCRVRREVRAYKFDTAFPGPRVSGSRYRDSQRGKPRC